MNIQVRSSEANAKLKQFQAEEALWQHFVECVKADLGPDLAQLLDASMPDDWRITEPTAVARLKKSGCCDVLVKYARCQAKGRQAHDYRDIGCEAGLWHAGAEESLLGKYAVVRYELEQLHPDEAEVKPAPQFQWYACNDIENAFVVAEEYAKERQELEGQAKAIKGDAQARLRRVREG